MRTVQDYLLCRLCAEREETGIGQRVVPPSECYVCQGLMDQLGQAIKEVVRAVRRYQFNTFAVGISLPDGVQEREDELRADLKLMGKETIRAQSARLVSAGVTVALEKKVERNRPDLTVIVDMARGEVVASSRPLFFYARYTKPAGVSQKRSLCKSCSGRGCDKCEMTGFDQGPSVEELLRERLMRLCGTERMKVTWVGSEDRDSVVYPPGRPFIVELKNPVRRSVPRKFAVRAPGGLVSVTRVRLLPSRPTSLPPFKFRTLIKAISAKVVEESDLKELKKCFRRKPVRFDRPHEKPVTKTVYLARARRKGRNLTIEAVLDGGLPVKRFVDGELVSPSVSEVLKTEVRCRTFDIREVKEIGEFGFGKITRV